MVINIKNTILLICFLALSACTNSAGIAEFSTYSSVFDESAAVTSSIIDQLAAGERDIEQRARSRRNSIGIDPIFKPQDAEIFSELADPPLAAQYRHALAVIKQYNKIMLGYASGQGFAELEAEIFGLANEAGTAANIISGGAGVAKSLVPYLGILREIANYALTNKSRAAFRQRALKYHDDMIGIMEAMRDGSKEMFPNLTESIKRDILTAVGSGAPTGKLRAKHDKVRILLSDWVIMMDRNIDALNKIKLAIENPALGTHLSGVTKEIIRLRSTVDSVRRHLAAVNAQ